MPWVRFDDQYPQHPKIGPLNDRLYRLHNAAVFWSSRHTTDGVIRAELLSQIRAKARPKDAAQLVARRLWHAAGDDPCPSEHCPPPGPDGWVIHDFWGYQPSRRQVEKDRRDRAERQKRWRSKKRGSDPEASETSNGNVDALQPGDRRVSNGQRNGGVEPAPYPPPARPAPKEAGAEPPSGTPAAADAGGAAGGRNEQPRAPAPPPADQLAETRLRIAAAQGKLNAAGARREHGTAFAELQATTASPPQQDQP